MGQIRTSILPGAPRMGQKMGNRGQKVARGTLPSPRYVEGHTTREEDTERVWSVHHYLQYAEGNTGLHCHGPFLHTRRGMGAEQILRGEPSLYQPRYADEGACYNARRRLVFSVCLWELDV